MPEGKVEALPLNLPFSSLSVSAQQSSDFTVAVKKISKIHEIANYDLLVVVNRINKEIRKASCFFKYVPRFTYLYPSDAKPVETRASAVHGKKKHIIKTRV